MADNTVTVVGNLTRDPEVTFTKSGKAVANLGLAQSYRKANSDEEVTSFFDVSAWDTLAENVGDSLQKGMRVVVTGRLQQDSWEKDGETRTKVKIVADEIAPSLRWASAEVTRNPRDGEASGSKAPANSRPSRQVNPNEEPF